MADIKVTFLYVDHRPENAGQVLAEVVKANPDAVFLEWVTPDASERERAEVAAGWNWLSRIARENPDDPDVRRAQAMCKQQADTFTNRFLGEALGSVKRIEFVDITGDNPLYAEAIKWQELDEGMEKLIDEGRVEEAFELFLQRTKIGADTDREREKIVAEQLGAWFTSLLGREVKRIVVVQGVTHTPTCHIIKQWFLSFRVVYRCVPFFPHHVPRGWKGRYVFASAVVLERRKRFFPGREIPIEDYRRAFIGEVLVGPEASRTWPQASPCQLSSFTNLLIAQLSKEEVDKLFLATSLAGEKEFAAGDAAQLVKELAERYGMAIEIGMK